MTVACVPTGAKAGMATSPWGVENTPARARERGSVLINVKLKAMRRIIPQLTLQANLCRDRPYGKRPGVAKKMTSQGQENGARG